MASPCLSRKKITTFLLNTPMFEELEPAETCEMVQIVDALKYSTDDIIFHEGDYCDAWYILYKGQVEILKHSKDDERFIKILGPHSCFGEIAVLDGLPRSATIRSVTESVVLRILIDEFNELIYNNNLAAYKLIKQMAITLADRQRSTTRTLSRLLANELRGMHEDIREQVGYASFEE
jgi:CRP-like cAMP-binding protein